MGKKCLFIFPAVLFFLFSKAQTAEEIIHQVKAKIDKVNNYEAKGTLKTNVSFIKAPVADVKIYFKKPDRVRIKNETGISLVPKGSVNINVGNVLTRKGGYDVIDGGKENGTALRIIKLLPKDEEANIVLSTLYVDEKNLVIKKAKITTRENGTYELEMTYGKYINYGLPDKIIFLFNAKDYKLPKGVTFDYDDGIDKKENKDISKDDKGKIEINYDEYKLNMGVSDAVFN